MIPFSILDLAPVTAGSDAGAGVRATRSIWPQLAERLGYQRYWLAEHHNMPGIASAATAVLIGHVAGGTSTIRVGAGGIMLPNHAPLQVAEQFGTLASLYPGRIDLGLGRAPGTDQAHREGAAPLFRQRRRVPARRAGTAALLRTGRSPASRCARCPARASRCRCGCSAPACSVRSCRRSSVCRLRSPRTSRRMRWTRRWRCTAATSSRRRDCAEPYAMLGAERGRRRQRRRGAAPVHHPAAELRQPAPRPARADPAADRRHRGVLDAAGETDGRACAGLRGGRRGRYREATASRPSSHDIGRTNC